MIIINENSCEFKFKVDTNEKKVMNTLSPTSFEKACIAADVMRLMLSIDQKYGKGEALKLFGMVTANIYTIEEIDQADKEINEDE